MPKDIEIPVAGACLEERRIGAEPAVENFLDDVLGVSQPETDWRSVVFPAPALDGYIHPRAFIIVRISPILKQRRWPFLRTSQVLE